MSYGREIYTAKRDWWIIFSRFDLLRCSRSIEHPIHTGNLHRIIGHATLAFSVLSAILDRLLIEFLSLSLSLLSIGNKTRRDVSNFMYLIASLFSLSDTKESGGERFAICSRKSINP
jgi:hypothetical protein